MNYLILKFLLISISVIVKCEQYNKKEPRCVLDIFTPETKESRCILKKLTDEQKIAKISEGNKNIGQLIRDHCNESINQLKEFLKLLDELKKNYPEEVFVVEGAYYQDMQGIKRTAAVDSSSYKSCEEVKLLDKKLSDCTSVAAAHLLGFNLRILNEKFYRDNYQVHEQMVQLLAKTNYLPEIFNGGPDKIRDNLFLYIVKGFIKDKDQTVDQAMKILYIEADKKLSIEIDKSTDSNQQQMLKEIQSSFRKHNHLHQIKDTISNFIYNLFNFILKRLNIISG